MLNRFLKQPIGFLLLSILLCPAVPQQSWAQSSENDKNRQKTPLQFRFKTLTNPALDMVGGQWATVEDSQGFIWFAGGGGLGRFDGYDIKLYVNDPDDPSSLNDNYVTDILIDKKGKMWISTWRGINRYNPTSDSFIRFDHEPKNSEIWDIEEDSDGSLWLATHNGGLVHFSPNTGEFKHLGHQPDNSNGLSSDALQKTYMDRHGMLWIGTRTNGVDRYDPNTDSYMHFPSIENNPDTLSDNTVQAFFEDSHNQLWVGTSVGLNRFNPESGTFKRYLHDAKNPTSLAGNKVMSILEDKLGNMWIASDGGGLSIYNREKDQFHQYVKKAGGSAGLVNNKIRSIFEDSRGGLWFGHYPAGITMLDRYASAFSNYKHNPFDVNSLSNNSAISVAEGRAGNLWVGTENGLNYIDRNTGEITRYMHSPDDNSSLPAKPVSSVLEDSHGVLWAGTYKGGLSRFDPLTFTFVRYKGDEKDDSSLKAVEIRALFEDSLGDIWLGTELGLSRYNRETDNFTHFTHDPQDPTSIFEQGVNTIYEDSRGNFWVGVNTGLTLMNRKEGTFQRFTNNPEDINSIRYGYIKAIGEDKENNIWIAIGTTGLDRFNIKTQSFEHYSKKNGLADNTVGAILSDNQGLMWFATTRGISRFDLETKKFHTYTEEHGLPGNSYNKPSSLKTSKGELIFGSTKGLTIFHPLNIAQNKASPPIAITKLQIFNKLVPHGTAESPLKNAINYSESFTLTHKQSVFSFEFVALDYTMPQKNEYAYKLAGFDQDWVYSGTRRSTTYTNLDAGDYVFKVKGANNEGIWNEEGTYISIHILPPWWRTWWAYTIYVLCVLAIIVIFVRSQQKKVRDAQEKMEMERAVVQRLEHLDKLKDDFLANTSHELRTPLNGIIGLADSLMEGAAGDISDLLRSNLNMISVSGRRLAHLVNDILDFSKLKNKKITINAKPVDLYNIAEIVITICRPSVTRKKLKLVNNIDQNLPVVIADEDRLQQVLYNFIGNAIKFTETGSIEVFATLNEGKIWVHIKDTGIGIPANMTEKIFDSFEQVAAHESRSQGGAGLGLSVTKQIVELLNGEIAVESKEDIGSIFSFSLPVSGQSKESTALDGKLDSGTVSKCLDFGSDDVSESTGTTDSVPILSSLDTIKTEEAGQTTPPEEMEDYSDNARFKILIVDDDAINRQVLLNQLQMKNYSFEVASSGPQALELMDTKGPFDLILLDIMMPGMSGYEVCTQVRKSFSIQELPIIFLTAKTLIADLADGFEVGANDFLTKPISIGELSSRVRTHLQLLDMNKNLETKVEQRTKEVTLANTQLKTLDNIVATIHQELRFDRLLKVILNEAMTLFPTADHAAYWNLEKEERQFKLFSTKDINFDAMGKDTTEAIHQNDESSSFETLSTKEINDRYINKGNQISDHIYSLGLRDIKSIGVPTSDIVDTKSALTIAMILDNEVVGVLVLGSNESENTFISSQSTTLDRFRSHVISALSKSSLVGLLESHCDELENISVTDQLTGLHNRRFLYKYIDTDITNVLKKHQQRISSGEKVSVLAKQDFAFFLLDIDHFKNINDSYGHIAGDKILTDMGAIISSAFRGSDYCIRWGGEEFLIVARYCTRDSAPKIAENIRSLVENHRFVIADDTTVPTTCSIGFACYPFLNEHPDAFDWQQVLDVADTCLYSAKKSSRNAWVGIYADQSSDIKLIPKILENAKAATVDSAVVVKSSFDQETTPLEWK